MSLGPAHSLPGRRTDVVHVVGFAVAYAAAMTFSRSFGIGTVVLSFVWPACGVATLWLLFARDRRRWLLDVAVLGVVTALVNFGTGLGLGLSAWFGLVNVLQAVLGAARVHDVGLGELGDHRHEVGRASRAVRSARRQLARERLREDRLRLRGDRLRLFAGTRRARRRQEEQGERSRGHGAGILPMCTTSNAT